MEFVLTQNFYSVFTVVNRNKHTVNFMKILVLQSSSTSPNLNLQLGGHDPTWCVLPQDIRGRMFSKNISIVSSFVQCTDQSVLLVSLYFNNTDVTDSKTLTKYAWNTFLQLFNRFNIKTKYRVRLIYDNDFLTNNLLMKCVAADFFPWFSSQ